MNIENVNKILKEKFNCQVVDVFKYCDKEIAQGIETLENGIKYRYFDLKEDVVEVTQKDLLEYFSKKNEIHLDIEY